MQEHSAEPWYADARLALEQEDAGDYANEDELADLARRFLPIYFAHFDERAREYSRAASRPNVRIPTR